jgi:hypothetical protein
MKHFKAQAAMEYLMTYGWAILIVIIVFAALWALGVFNPSTWSGSSAAGFSGFSVPAGGWQVSSTQVKLILKNAAGANIRITNLNATFGTVATNQSSPFPANLGPNNQTTFTLDNAPGTAWAGPTSGSSYTITVNIKYDNLDTGMTGFTSSGTITGNAI